MRSKRITWAPFALLLVIGVLVLAACQPIMPESEMTAESNTSSAPESSDVTVMLSSTDELGDFVVDSAGKTLYMFLKDEENVSNCYDQCAERWPPLIVDGDVKLGDGLDEALVGTTERTDGAMQLTYNGWPLYYWWEDIAAGDTFGQGVGDVWFVLTPAGEIVGYEPSTIMVGNTDELGDFVVDSEGMTLYMFTKDEENVSNCYDQCAERWPPLIVDGDVKLGDGLDEALVGTTERTDGAMQLTYNGWPLYYWWEDIAAGDTFGQGVGDVWYVVTPAGELVQ